MKPMNVFFLMAACLLAMAAAEEDTVEEFTAEEEQAAAEDMEAAAAEEEEMSAEEEEAETMDDEERGHLLACRQSCAPLIGRCIRAAPIYTTLPTTRVYRYAAPAYRCVTRRTVIRTVISPCRRTCYAQYGYGFPGCVRQCAAQPATFHRVAEPHQVSTAATFFPTYGQCRTVCPDRCYMAHRGFFRCGLLLG
jgi:hypothetical protein